MPNRIVGNCFATMSSQIRSVTELSPSYLRDQTDVLVVLTRRHLGTCEILRKTPASMMLIPFVPNSPITIASLMYLMSRCFSSLLNSHWDSPAKRP